MAKGRMAIGLELLDRQLLDRDGRRCGKVDDLELSTPEGEPEGTAPVVTAILTGPGAMEGRLWGWPGKLSRLMWRRISPNPRRPRGRVPIEQVERLDYDVHLNITAEEAGLDDREGAASQLVRHIPGSGS